MTSVRSIVFIVITSAFANSLLVAHTNSAFRDSPSSSVSQSRELKRFEFSSAQMGTEFRIILYARDARLASAGAQVAFARIAQLDETMSDYRETSELMRLCHQPAGEWVPLSRDLFAVLSRAQTLAAESRGAFDVTAAPLVKLWRRARRTSQLPDPEKLRAARGLTGYNFLQLNPRTRRGRLLKPGMLLDLGGIAKGYAADEALKVLQTHGIRRALVAASGDIRAGDPPPQARGWRVGVAGLEPVRDPTQEILLLANAAVSTSGDAEQFVEIGGVRYSHIVDPRTGLGVRDRMSTTVVAPDAITADALATAVSVLKVEDGISLVERTGGASASIAFLKAGKETSVASANWEKVPKITVSAKARDGESRANTARRLSH
jgi:thiamine biosynthesis lipoprotein